jgi:hypothetical protein
MPQQLAFPVLLAVLISTSAAAIPLSFLDEAGDVQANGLGGQIDPDTLDVLRVTVGQESPEYIPISFQVARLPTSQDSNYEVTFTVTGKTTNTNENIRASATFNSGEWSYGYQISGQGRSVALMTEGAVSSETQTVTTKFPRFQIENPSAGDGITILTAQSIGGLAEVILSCDFEACDDVQVNGTYQFETSTGAGVTWTELNRTEDASLKLNGEISFQGPDLTIASSNPAEFSAAIIGDSAASVYPGKFALRVGETVKLNISIENIGESAWLRISTAEGQQSIFALTQAARDEQQLLVPNATSSESEREGKGAPANLIPAIIVLLIGHASRRRMHGRDLSKHQ